MERAFILGMLALPEAALALAFTLALALNLALALSLALALTLTPTLKLTLINPNPKLAEHQRHVGAGRQVEGRRGGERRLVQPHEQRQVEPVDEHVTRAERQPQLQRRRLHLV